MGSVWSNCAAPTQEALMRATVIYVAVPVGFYRNGQFQVDTL